MIFPGQYLDESIDGALFFSFRPVLYGTVARVDRSFGVTLQQARTAKGWTQKDLANRISEKPNVIGEYESGRAVPNPAIVSKMERALGVHLPRTYKKK